MPTQKLFLDSEKIDKALSGSYYLLFEGGGHTGSLDLKGSSRFDYVNAYGAAVQNSLNVTGNQVNFGNLTGYNYNHLARISCTGDAYINRITGNLKIGGNVDLNNNLRVTGQVNITGSLFVNGIQITGNGVGGSQTGFLTGNFASLYNNRGDILVGTGVGLFDIFTTGGATSGQHLIYDPSSNIPFRWGNETGVGGSSLTHFSEIFTNNISVFRPTGSTANTVRVGLSPNGQGGVYIGGTGNTIGNRGVSIGFSNSTVNSDSIVIGQGNSTTAAYTTAIGNSAVADTIYEFVQGGGVFDSNPGTFQSSIYLFKGVNSSDSAFTLGTFPVPENYSIAFRILVVGVQDNDSNGADPVSAAYEIKGCARQENGAGGTVTIIGSPSVTVLGEDDSAWNANVSTNTSSINVDVYGASADTVRWGARVETVRVGF